MAAWMLPASVALPSFENLVRLAEQLEEQSEDAADRHAHSFARVLKPIARGLKAIYTLRQASNSYHLSSDKRQARAAKRLTAHMRAFVYEPKSPSSSHGLGFRV